MEKKQYIQPVSKEWLSLLSQIIALSTDNDNEFDSEGGWNAKDRNKKEEKTGNWSHLW